MLILEYVVCLYNYTRELFAWPVEFCFCLFFRERTPSIISIPVFAFMCFAYNICMHICISKTLCCAIFIFVLNPWLSAYPPTYMDQLFRSPTHSQQSPSSTAAASHTATEPRARPHNCEAGKNRWHHPSSGRDVTAPRARCEHTQSRRVEIHTYTVNTHTHAHTLMCVREFSG